MAKIPRSSRRVLSSGAVPGAQVSFDIADTGQGIEARGLGDLGRGVSQLGSALAEIAIRDRKASDLKQSSVDAVGRRSNQLAVEEWKNNNPLDQHTSENFGRVWDDNDTFEGLNYIDDNARDRATIVNEAERDHFIRTQSIQASDVRIRDTILSSEATYLSEPNEINRQNYENALNLQHTSERSGTLLDVADAKVLENQKELLADTVSGAAFGAWQATGNVDDALDVVQASDVAEGDKQELEGEVLQRIGYREGQDKLQLEQQQEDDRATINRSIYTEPNYQLAADEVQVSALTEKEKQSYLKEIDSRAKLAAKGEPERNDPVALDRVNTAIRQVGNNQLPLEAAKKILRANQAKLKSVTADTKWNEINKEFDASIDTAAAKVESTVRLFAVGKSETALDRLLAAVVSKTGEEKESLDKRISTARVKFNLELEQYNRWIAAQSAWKQTNKDASPDEIQREGLRSWYTEFNITDEDELRSLSETFTESLSGETGPPPPAKTIVMVSPEGEEFNVPPEKRQRFIDNGFVEK